ncbi:transposase [Psychromonas ossibalaenae]|uniref:transposase n=1 Tax=Psychromonas ossibalaenae TaxID=444922 RepID=UPI00037FA18F|nr:transposase [Psychromonas ossibalaenae]
MVHHHLPHFDTITHYQFITFRTNDSTDAFLHKLSVQNQPNNKKQLQADCHLDTSYLGAYLNDDVLLYLCEFIKSKNRELYQLIAFVIIPNHVHLLIKPLKSLPVLMHSIKGASAKSINEIIGRSGPFWAAEYYDKAIRDEKHFNIVYNYIKNNLLKLNEEESILRFYGIYEIE